jgi:uncharacterized protein (DUF1499 family)
MALSLSLFSCSGVRPNNLGINNGELAPCPNSPNCVSTKAQDKKHAIPPIRYTSSRQEAMAKLIAIIRSMPRTSIVATTDDYLQVEFTSAVFRFVDDVEFYLDNTNKTIQFRSASRLGYSDFGVNRKRMKEISRRFKAS